MFRVQSGADDKLFITFIVLQKKSGKIMNLDRFSVQKKNQKNPTKQTDVSHTIPPERKNTIFTLDLT